MKLSLTDALSHPCPNCDVPAGEACEGARTRRNGEPWERLSCHRERWEIAEQNAEVYTLQCEGILANSGDEAVGTLVGLTLTLDLPTLRGGGGHGALDLDPATSASGTTTDLSENASGTQLQSHLVINDARVTRPEDVVWAHYQRHVKGGNRRKLEAKRRQIIRDALKVRDMSTVLKAIEGLAASPHHNGKNDRKTEYLGIQYALKGLGSEGNDERIDKMAAKAGDTVAGVLSNIPSAGREMVRTRQRQVEDMLLHPGDENRKARGEGSAAYLHDTFGIVARVRTDDGAVVWERTDA